ncbi:MAG TPA: ATP-binding protein [Chthoniobacter sp.]|nr:ATP-binding protein [Chthoniobacter sp.]
MPHIPETDGGSASAQERLFPDSLSHLLAELERIDLLLQLQVRRARELTGADGQFHGLCISEAEVDALLERPCGLPAWAHSRTGDEQVALERSRELLEKQAEASARRGVDLRLRRLAQRLSLSPLDIEIVLLCLAPELDLRYEKLYAYLQDDVTRKEASVDLVLNVLCPTFVAKTEARARFEPDSPLRRHEVVQLFSDPAQPEQSLLRKVCRLDPAIVNFLLGRDAPDPRWQIAAEWRRASQALVEASLLGAQKDRLQALAREAEAGKGPMVLALQGTDGVDNAAIAARMCGELQRPLLIVDAPRLSGALAGEMGWRMLQREALLRGAGIFWRGFAATPGEAQKPALEDLLRLLGRGAGLHFVELERAWEPPSGLVDGGRFVRVELQMGGAERIALWENALPLADRAEGVDLVELSRQFRLEARQIAGAAASAKNLARARQSGPPSVTTEDLRTACRLHSNRSLASLARHVQPRYRLRDIVLPPAELAQLRETIVQATYRHVVLGDWGFDGKLSLGKGLNALFSGPPGTGKTMAAEVIARELGLDLYKIDIALLVSKYIGETEKNLDRIFREARGSNAVLMFDEADALFGKRSEVRDSHDRYANLEVGYLLQKMEEYEGIAILATNLRQNIDDAFLRRLHVIIEFPFPDEEHRLAMWQRVFPGDAPLGADVDFVRLARGVRLAGGSINNIALAAAFTAAGEGVTIQMDHLLQASRREHQKLGRTWGEHDMTKSREGRE